MKSFTLYLLLFTIFLPSLSFAQISTTLRPGDQKIEVNFLQKILNRIGIKVTEIGEETNYFGNTTAAAIKAFQCEQGIVCEGTPSTTGFGIVGPKTRELLNNLAKAFNLNSRSQLGAVAGAGSGLIAHYTFDTADNNIALDSAGNSNGTIINGAELVSGTVGSGALLFDGVNDYVNILHSDSLNTPQAITLSFWVKVPPNQPISKGLMSKSGVFHFRSVENNAGPTFYTRNSDNTLRGFGIGRSLQDNIWHHITFTYDSNATQPKSRVYLDGIQAGSDNGQVGLLAVNTNDIKIGLGFSSDYFNGYIDDVRIYNRALAPDEVITLKDLAGTDGGVQVSTDNINPTVSFTAPTPGSTMTDTVTITAEAVDAGGVKSVQFKLDGANLQAADTTAPYSITWDTKNVSNGAHELRAVVTDMAGNTNFAAINVSVSNQILVEEIPVDTAPPQISSIEAKSNDSSTAVITWITNEAADTRVEYGLTNLYGTFTSLITSKVTNHSQTLTGLTASTTYYYRVISKDSLGNVASSSGLLSFTTEDSNIDISAPIISGGSPGSSLDVGTKSTLMSVATNENATCKYGTSEVTSYDSMANTFSITGGLLHSIELTGLIDGSNITYYVKCRDQKGNSNQRSYQIEVSVASGRPLPVEPLVDDHSIAMISAGALDINKTGWNFYNSGDAPEGAYMGWVFAGEPSITVNLNLPRSLEAKRYYVFTYGINYGARSNIQVLAGGGASNIDAQDDRDGNKYWSNRFTLDVQNPTDILTVKLIKSGALSGTEKYLFRGIYITDNPNEIVSREGIVIELNYPTQLDQSPPIKGNLITNSSFETGIDATWGFSQNKNVIAQDSWDATEAYEGKASVKIPLDPSTNTYGTGSGLATKVYSLKPNKKYTLSFWMKTSPGKTAGVSVRVNNAFAAIPAGFRTLETQFRTAVATDRWQRMSITFDALKYPKSDYQFEINTENYPGGALWIDAVQLEEGELTNYTSSNTVEAGLIIKQPSNIFYEDESKSAELLARNTGSSTALRDMKYEIYNYRNKLVESGTKSLIIPANATIKTSFNLQTGDLGIFRIVYWIEGEPNTERELAYSIVPRYAKSGFDEKSFMGIHPMYIESHFKSLEKLGIKWGRVMSPSQFFRWSVVEPVDDQFKWYDAELALGNRYGIMTMGTLGTNDFWPDWADRGGKPDLDKWAEYVSQTVRHYKGLVKYWEIWNEPYGAFTANFYAQMLKRATDAIEAEDPDAKIVGMGGIPLGAPQNEQYMRMTSVIRELESLYPTWDWTKHIDILSTHDYPGGIPPEIFKPGIIDKYGLPVWNTEAGVWDLGFYQGQSSNFVSNGKNLWPHVDAYRFYNGMAAAPRLVVENFIRTVGSGQTNYFYYDSRLGASLKYFLQHTTLFEHDLTIRSKGVAYAIAGSFVDGSIAIGDASPDSGTFAYVFDKNGTGVVSMWSKDKKAKSIQLNLTEGGIKVYDLMGNEMPQSGNTVAYGRIPIYIKGIGMTPSQLQTAFREGNISSRSDNVKPNVSISDAPRGVVKDRNFRIRWIAIDDQSFPNLGEIDPEANVSSDLPNPNAILYSYRLGSSTSLVWSPWTASTYKDYSNMPEGVYTFEVKSKDDAGNISNTASRTFEINASGAPLIVESTSQLGSDSDSDGVLNNIDRCPSTPLFLRSYVNIYGCPKPIFSALLDIRPDLNLDLKALTNLELGRSSFGKIGFNESISLTRETSQLNLDTANISFTNKKVVLNSNALPELNKPAVITLYNITEKNPKILKDGVECTTCTITSFVNGTLTFIVDGFSTYEVVEGTTPPVIVPDATSSSGGGSSKRRSGGGGGSSSSTIIAKIPEGCFPGFLFSSINGQACPKTVSTNSSNNGAGYTFTRDLDVGFESEDVRQLQIFLNSQGFIIASAGIGSPDNETTYFGNLTKLAVSKFQTSNGIVPAMGYFGPKTRGIVNGGSMVVPQPIAPQSISIPSNPSVPSASGTITTWLLLYSTHPQVTTLQTILSNKGYFSSGGITGSFDIETDLALKKFQCEKLTVCSGNPDSTGYGATGPKTRAALNN